jgi:hypothetical protein
MKGRLLQGKTIKKVHQVYLAQDNTTSGQWVLDRIEFTDGTYLAVITVETEGEHEHALVYPANAPEGTSR